MLVVKVYVTKVVGPETVLEKIDELQIQQVAKKGNDIREYKIVMPAGIKATITHVRSEGYRPLLERVLALLGKPPKGPYRRRRRK